MNEIITDEDIIKAVKEIFEYQEANKETIIHENYFGKIEIKTELCKPQKLIR